MTLVGIHKECTVYCELYLNNIAVILYIFIQRCMNEDVAVNLCFEQLDLDV